MTNMDIQWEDVLETIIGGKILDEDSYNTDKHNIKSRVLPRSLFVTRTLSNGICRYINKAGSTDETNDQLMEIAKNILNALPDECIDKLVVLCDRGN